MRAFALAVVLLATFVLVVCGGGRGTTRRAAWKHVQSTDVASAKHWQEHDDVVHEEHVMRFLIGLPVTNSESLRETALAVSSPSSPRYGRYMTQADVIEHFGPTASAVEVVEEFLHQHEPISLQWSVAKDFAVVEMTADRVAAAFQTQLCWYQHTGVHAQVPGAIDRIVRACGRSAPSLPASVRRHIGVIEGLFNFPWMQQRGSKTSFGRSNADNFSFSASAGDSTVLVKAFLADSTLSGVVVQVIDPLVAGWMVQQEGDFIDGTATVSFQGLPNFVNFTVAVCAYAGNASECGTTAPFVQYQSAVVPRPWVSVEAARRLYGIPRATASPGLATQSVAEFSAQYYDPDDVNAFYRLMGLSLPSSSPSPDIRVIGPNNPAFPGGESTLDIEWVLAIAPQAPTYFWSIGNGGFLLEWIMQMSNTTDPPLITSISYGEPEALMLKANQERFNEEAMKLAVRGVGIISTSGDLGSSDGLDVCGGDVPDFPSSSPWTTSLGATFVTRDRISPLCAGGTRKPLFASGGIEILCAANAEAPCQSDRGSVGFTTGGGFSRRFEREDYQGAAVEAYLNSKAAKSSFFPPEGWFNSSGRGFNDIAALGSNILIVRNGHIETTGGTSASGPILAGLVTLLNDQRLAAGRPPLGFLNPFLYHAAEHYPESFNLVLGGDNRCRETEGNGVEDCCEYGFPSLTPLDQTIVWNPLVGLGTPNYVGLLRAAMEVQ